MIPYLMRIFNISINNSRVPDDWKSAIVVPIYKAGDKGDVNNYRDLLCGLVVSVEDYKHRGPGFNSRALLRIFLRELDLERGPLSLVIG
jgi:hypothetical protein